MAQSSGEHIITNSEHEINNQEILETEKASLIPRMDKQIFFKIEFKIFG
jgi:hypothetical protein